ALRQYRQLGDVLRRELQTEPLPTTQALYRAVLAGRLGEPAPAGGERPAEAEAGKRAPPAGPPHDPAGRFTPPTSFIGREREIAAIGRLLAGSLERQPGTAPRLLTLT